MNTFFSYPATTYKSILAQMYVFLVVFTIFDFTMIFKTKLQNYFSTIGQKYSPDVDLERFMHE